MTVASMSAAFVMDGFFSAWNATLDDATRGTLGADSMSPDFLSAQSMLHDVDPTSRMAHSLRLWAMDGRRLGSSPDPP